MSLTSEQFSQWWFILAQKYGKEYGPPTIAAFYREFAHCDPGLFEQACRIIFRGGEQYRFMPDPAQVLALIESLKPAEQFQLPASTPKAFTDMSGDEKKEYLEALEQARSQIQAIAGGVKLERNASGFYTIGKPTKTLADQVEQYNAWLMDRVMRAEAIEWAKATEGVTLKFDDLGNIVGLELKEGVTA